MFHDTVCLFFSPDLDGHRAPNEALTLQDPQKVPNPKYEATVLHSHPSIGYSNSTNGQYTLNHCTTTALSDSFPVKH